MVGETEGIVLRQFKAVNGRRMIRLFSGKYGKISVGTNLNEGGKSKTALAIRPFIYGKYEIFMTRESYNLNSAYVKKSYYKIGENLDKYLETSFVLELTDKLLIEGLPQQRIFLLLLDFLEAMEEREKSQSTLVLSYMIKILNLLGAMPNLEYCILCGEKEPKKKWEFSVKEGGIICPKCAEEIKRTDNEPLIYSTNFGIVGVLKYLNEKPFSAFKNLALDEKIASRLKEILKDYMEYHFDIGKLKSESVML